LRQLPVVELSTWGSLLAALAYTAFAAHLLRIGELRLKKGRSSLFFGTAVLASAGWGWLAVIHSYADLPLGQVVGLFDLIRYALWFAFVLSSLAPATGGHQKHILLLISIAAILTAIGLAAFVLQSVGALRDSRPALLVALALPIYGLTLTEQLFRNTATEGRWNIKPLCLGLLVVFLFDLYVFSQGVLFGELNPNAVSIRAGIHAFAAPLLYLSSHRRRDWIARLKISRAAAFHSTGLFLAGVYLLFVATIGYYIRFFGGEWGAALQLASISVAVIGLVVFSVSGTMRSRLRVLVGKHFFRYRYDYREEWLRFTSMLSAEKLPGEMGTLVVQGMADLVESPSGALWMREGGGGDYVQTARWNSPVVSLRESANSSLIRFLQQTGWVIELNRYRMGSEHYPALEVSPWLVAELQSWLAIPLLVGEDLVGFVTLGPPRTPIDMNWEVTDLLKTASRQAAGYLAQMLMTEALLEARKFDAFNRMSAFVVHDLKNIVAQLSLMLSNAKRLHANPEFQQDMLATVENSLEKMRQLMLQLREGEASPSGRSGVDLAPIVRRIESVVSQRGRTIDVQIHEPVATRGHEARIERVVGHVVQNALDATQNADKVWLSLGRKSGLALVEVGDTGSGMSKQYIETALFKPFQSTKEAGLGIGAYESYQYVRELGGSITVESEPGRGTIMRIFLPLFEAHQSSVLDMSNAQ
jgi:putative PEP-CTERM system histidine kinase